MGNYTSLNNNNNNDRNEFIRKNNNNTSGNSNIFDGMPNRDAAFFRQNYAIIYPTNQFESLDDLKIERNNSLNSSSSIESQNLINEHKKDIQSKMNDKNNFNNSDNNDKINYNSEMKIINDNDMKLMLLSSFDTFINQIIQEKLSKYNLSDDNKDQMMIKSSIKHQFLNHNQNNQYKIDMITKSVFDNLAKMLTTRLDDYLAACKRSGIVTSPVYKCCKENYEKKFNNTNNDIEHQRIIDKTSKALTTESPTTSVTHSRRTSLIINNMQNMLGDYNLTIDKSNLFNNLNNLNGQQQQQPQEIDNNGSIRINLPEILDNQDEISILRLLIKLLSSKVKKLTDENNYLLQQMSLLNDINIELSTIIQSKLDK